MSRCFACNHILKPSEATRKFKESNTYTELCNTCLGTIDDEIETIEGEALDDELFDDLGNPLEED